MRLPNGYGSVVKMSGKRRKPYMVRKTIGWHLDETKGRQIQDFQIIGYAETRAEGLRMLAEYNQNPYDVNVAKVTFSEVYERWSKYKYPIISDSNAKAELINLLDYRGGFLVNDEILVIVHEVAVHGLAGNRLSA